MRRCAWSGSTGPPERPLRPAGYRRIVSFTFVLLLMLVGGLAVFGLALSGYGSSDRSGQTPPRLPGHVIQEQNAERDRRDDK